MTELFGDSEGPSPNGQEETPDPFGGEAHPAAGDDAPEGSEDPAEPGVEPGEGTVLTDAASLAAERDEYLAALQRLKADFDNYRKRVLRQQEEQADRAAGALVVKLLPVLDHLDLARAHLGGDDGPEGSEEARALSQARSQLLEVLAKEGLDRVADIDVAFDPVVHDAVAHAPEEESSPADDGVTVDQVMRAGYRWRGQVLRPAMVRVRG